MEPQLVHYIIGMFFQGKHLDLKLDKNNLKTF